MSANFAGRLPIDGKTDVLIVGAGPTGLTLACELLVRGVSFRIIDRSTAPTAASRAIGVSARALEVLNHFGAAEPLADRGVRCASADFYSGARKTARISAASVRHCRFPFMLSVPQSATEEILEKRLVELGGRAERGVELVDLVVAADNVTATLSSADGRTQETVQAAWVVGADGSHSRVRQLSGIPFDTVELPETFMIVDVSGERRSAADGGHYFFHPDGMALIAPLPDGSFRLAATVHGEHERVTTLESVQELFDRRTGSAIRVRELRDAGWGVTTVKVRTGIADRMRSGRCLIAGDAAHSYGPLGGQGMNGGIQDAFNLAWKLTMVCRGLAGESLLDSYEKERLHAASLAMQAADSQTRLATVRPLLLRGLRDVLMGVGAVTGLLDRLLVPTLTQLAIAYSPEALSGTDQEGASDAGGRIPDTSVLMSVGEKRLHDVLQPRLFTALMLGTGPSDASEVHSLAAYFGGTSDGVVTPVVLTRPGRQGGLEGLEVGVDVDGLLHRELGVRKPTAVLVRPDGRIAATRPLSAARELTTVLERVLGSAVAAVA